MSPIDAKSACYYQGRNARGESLPERAAFKPFFPWSFMLPITTAAEYAQVLAWCSAALGERDDGRWIEDFDVWHLGDEAAAEAFEAAWIAPHAKPVWGRPQVRPQES